VLLPTQYGQVKVDVLEVREVEVDQPSDDPGDRLHASSHAWANDTASDEQARATALAQLGGCNASTATDIALHVDLWLVRRRKQALRLIQDAGGVDDLDLVAELHWVELRRSVERASQIPPKTIFPEIERERVRAPASSRTRAIWFAMAGRATTSMPVLAASCSANGVSRLVVTIISMRFGCSCARAPFSVRTSLMVTVLVSAYRLH
jgi:hypothetical protein